MRSLLIACTIGAALLTGCAATVRMDPPKGVQFEIPVESRNTVMLNVIGNQLAEESTDWESFKGAWRDAMAASAAEKASCSATSTDHHAPPARGPRHARGRRGE